MNRLKTFIPFALLVSYAIICLLFFVRPGWHSYWDSGIYLITAKNLANGLGYTYLDQPFFLRPPGFSYFLSFIINPEGNFNYYKLNLIMMIIGIGALAAIYLVMTQLNNKVRAAAITLLLGTSPLFVSQFNDIMSEYLFLCLFFLGMWFILPPGRGFKNPLWRGIAGAVLVGGSLYVRSMGLVLLPGLIAIGFRDETGARRFSGVLQAILIVMLLFPWLQHSSQMAEQAPKPLTQLMIFSYSTALLHTDTGDPLSPYVTMSDWISRIKTNFPRLCAEIGENILHGTRTRGAIAVLLVSAGFVLACLRSFTIMEWLTISFTGVIILYFTYDGRLVLPLIVMFYHYFFVAVEYIGEQGEKYFKKKNIITSMLSIAFVMLLSLNVLSMPVFLANPDTKKGYDLNLRAAAEWINKNTPENATILHKFPPNLSVLTGRTVYGYMYLRGHPIPDVDYVVLDFELTDFEPQIKRDNLGSVVLPGDSAYGDIRIYRIR